jgi:hypothetical protein
MFCNYTAMANDEPSNGVALLTKTERDWLLGKLNISNDYQNHLRSRIKRKLQIFSREEIPLLLNRGLIRSMTAGFHEMTTERHDSCPGSGRWPSLDKIPQQTWRNSDDTEFNQKENKTKFKIPRSEWAGSDSNQRPPPCQGGILTRLDHRPPRKRFFLLR